MSTLRAMFTAICVAMAALTGAGSASAATVSWAYNNGNPVLGNAGVINAGNWNLTGDSGSANMMYSDATPSGTTLSLAGGFGAWGIGGVSSPDADGTYNKAIFDGYYSAPGKVPFCVATCHILLLTTFATGRQISLFHSECAN